MCSSCGAPVDAESPTVVGERPALGTLTFDDGATLELTRSVVIGSDVPADYEIDGEAATIVELNNDESVSPVHVEIRLRGWDVELVDVQSSGGTFTRGRRELQSRTRIRPEHPTVLMPGSEVRLGSRSFVYTVGPPPPPNADRTSAEINWLKQQQA